MVLNCELYPTYRLAHQAKLKSHSHKTKITVSERIADVNLQVLLNYTAERILLAQMDLIGSLSSKEVVELNSIRTDDDGSKSDANVFFNSLVPLVSDDEVTNKRIILWKNSKTLSLRFCRPIRI